MPDLTEAGTLLISMPEIADLADVQRAVVTTWRRRHADFPRPVAGRGSDASIPMFHAPDVVRWLAANPGRGNRRIEDADLRLYLLRCLGQRLGPRTFVAAASALLCLRHLDEDEPLAPTTPTPTANDHLLASLQLRAAQVDPEDRLLLSEVRALGPHAGWLTPAVDELVEAAYNSRDAFERLLGARHRLNVPALYTDAVVPRLAKLMAELSGAREQARDSGVVQVADPAAGAGDLLAAVHAVIGEAEDVRLTGVEPDQFLARLARRRFTVAGVARRDLDLRASAGRRTHADAIVTCLPFRPAEARDAVEVLAQVRRIADTLRPQQTAVILGPAEALVDPLPVHRPAVRRRDELLATGLVEAIIQLPGGMVPFRPAYRTALWVLRREENAPVQGRVLLADISDRELTDDVVNTLVLDVATWRRDGFRPDEHLRTLASQAAIAQLTTRPGEASVALTAPRPTGEPSRLAARAVVRIREIDDRIASHRMADSTGQAAPDFGGLVAEREDPRALTTASIARLARATAPGGPLLRILPGARVAPSHIRPTGNHPVIGAPELTGSARVGGRRIDRIVLADAYPRAALTQPGDIIVTTGPRFGAHLDEDGYSIIEFPARGLRLTDAGRAVLTPRVLAALLVAAAPTGRAPGAVRGPRRLEDLCIAALPEPVVRRLDDLLAGADARQAVLRHELDMLDELRRTTVDGLVGGTLTLIAALAPSP